MMSVRFYSDERGELLAEVAIGKVIREVTGMIIAEPFKPAAFPPARWAEMVEGGRVIGSGPIAPRNP